MIEHITTATGLGPDLDLPGVCPKLNAAPGSLQGLAPTLGQHSGEAVWSTPAFNEGPQ